MSKDYGKDVHFYVVYIREAHPTDGRQVPQNERDKVLVKDPKTLAERLKVAKEFADEFKLSLPVLVDTLDDQMEKAYAGWPDRLYLIGRDGYIAEVFPESVEPADTRVKTAIARALADT